ncbi:MAG: 50S ribosomal protein L23 [Rickettsiales bacterium]|nr:50S ribosomal protein L23 [Rickettsiales bacterium]
MKKEDLYDVLRAPVITEKSTILSQFSKYVFKVNVDVAKATVKRAVESIFNVKVLKINSIKTKGKVKMFRRIKGERSDYKKMIITLEKGKSIDLNAEIK